MRWIAAVLITTLLSVQGHADGPCKKYWSIWTQLCGDGENDDIKDCILSEPTAQELAYNTLKTIALSSNKNLKESISKIRTMTTPNKPVIDGYVAAAAATCPALQNKFFKALANSDFDKNKLRSLLKEMWTRSFFDQPALLSVSIDSFNLKLSQQKQLIKFNAIALKELDAINKQIRTSREKLFKLTLWQSGINTDTMDLNEVQKQILFELSSTEKLREKMQTWTKKYWPANS